MSRPRVGVAPGLFELPAVGGHGKVWHRTLRALGRLTSVVAIDSDGAPTSRIRRRGPDVVLADGHAEPMRARVPVVVQVHEAGWFSDELRAVLDPRFYQHISAVTERAVRMADAVITPSHAAARDLVDLYGMEPASVHAVHHGVDELFRPGQEGGRALVAAALGRDRPYVLYAASLHPRKNLAALRQAMCSLIDAGFPHALAIAGMPAPDRADSSELVNRARSELPGHPGRVAYLGELDDRRLAALMADADVYCLPSLYEGFGLTVLEAMACGTAVLVSDRGALPEVVADAGWVVAPNVDEISASLCAILGDPPQRDARARAAAQRAREFTWERTAAGWLSVLRGASS